MLRGPAPLNLDYLHIKQLHGHLDRNIYRTETGRKQGNKLPLIGRATLLAEEGAKERRVDVVDHIVDCKAVACFHGNPSFSSASLAIATHQGHGSLYSPLEESLPVVGVTVIGLIIFQLWASNGRFLGKTGLYRCILKSPPPCFLIQKI